MKIKFISLVASFLLLMCCLVAPAMAADPSCTLQGGSALAVPGSTVEINVDISGNPGITEADLTVSWDEGLTLVDASVKGAFAVIKPNHDGGYENGCVFSWEESQANTTNGTMMTLTFEVAETAVRGKHYCVYVEMDGAKIIPGNVYVVNYVPGDVTGEGTLNMKDIVTFSRYASDDYMTNSDSYNVALKEIAADVNNDGKINMKDLVTLKRFASDDYACNPDSYNVELVPSEKVCKHPTLTHVEATSASATAAGNIEYWHCEMCGKCFTDANGANQIAYGSTILPKVSVHTHRMIHTVAVDPTCNSAGHIEYWTCETCFKVYSDANGVREITLNDTKLGVLSHELLETPYKAPTCTEPGNKAYWTCQNQDCGAIFADAEGKTSTTMEDVLLPKTAHDLVHWEAHASTCIEPGNIEYWTCDDCEGFFRDANGSEEIKLSDTVLPLAGHTLTSYAANAPSCTEDGNIAYWHCSVCEAYFSDAQAQNKIDLEDTVDPKTGHVNLTHTAAEDPTCTENGNIEYWTCSCGKIFSDSMGNNEIIDGTGTVLPARHTMIFVDEKTASCTEQGNIAHYWCSVCCKYFEDDTLEPVELKAEDVFYYEPHSTYLKKGYEPKCTENGMDDYWICLHCGRYFTSESAEQEITDLDDRVIEARGHDMTFHAAIPSTCEEQGTIAHYACGVCRKTFSDEAGKTEITDTKAPLAAHVLTKNEAKSVTCTTDGNIEYWTCNNCHEYYSDKQGVTEITQAQTVIEAVGHLTERIAAKEKTCTVPGNHEYWQCTTCNLYFKDQAATVPTTPEANVIPAGHEMNHVDAVPSTCTEAGNVEYWYCDACDKHYGDESGTNELDTIVDPADGHNMTHTEAKAATCEAPGNIEYWTCETCKQSFVDENGYAKLNASVEIPATGHETLIPTAKKEANCTEDGWEAYWTCEACGNKFSDEHAEHKISEPVAISATGHSTEVHEAKTPTCLAPGNEEYWTCKDCGLYFGDAEGTENKELSTFVLEAINHRDKEATAEVQATCTEDGNSAYWYCPDCKLYYADEACSTLTTLAETKIPAKGHIFVDGECECGGLKSTEGLTFSLNEDGKSYTLTGMGTCTATELVIDLHEGLPVTAISGGSADVISILRGEANGVIGEDVTSITIGKSVVSVDPKAFVACDGLSEIIVENNTKYSASGNCLMQGNKLVLGTVYGEIPENADTIGAYAYAGRSDAETLVIKKNITTIETGAFYGCSGLDMIIVEDENVAYDCDYNCLIDVNTNTVILGCATSGKGQLTTVPEGTKHIGAYAFAFTDIQNFIAPTSLVDIGEGAFEGCNKLELVNIPGYTEVIEVAVPFILQRPIASYMSGTMYVDAPVQGAASTKIGQGAFKGCKSLKKVTVGNGVSEVGSSAFEGCEDLDDVTIGTGVSEIDGSVFSGCGQITKMDINAQGYGHNEHGLFYEREDAHGNKYRKLVTGHKDTKLTAQDAVTEIGEGAFAGVTDLASFEIPETVEIIGKDAFKGTGLTSIVIPDSVQTIGENVFADCLDLISVTIGSGVREIGEGAFGMLGGKNNTHNISSIVVNAGNNDYKVVNNCLIHVESKTLVFAAKGCTIPADGSVTKIGAFAFAFSSIENVVLPETITEIGAGAFAYATQMTSLHIPASVATIGDRAFFGCSGLTSVTVAENNAGGFYAMSNCLIDANGTIVVGGKNVTIPTDTKVTAIGYGAFAYADVTRIEIPANIQTLVADSFAYCAGLQAIVLPAGIQIVDGTPFDGCSALSDIYYLGTAEEFASIKEDIPLGVRIHFMVELKATDATCDKAGNHAAWTCSDCGKFYSDHTGATELPEANVIIPAKGHDLTAHAEIDATCTEDGVKAYWSCSVCMNNFSDENGKFAIATADLRIPMKDHEMTLVSEKAPTCTEEGNIAYYTCSECGENYLDQNGKVVAQNVVVPARGHLLTAYAAKEPTCTEAGNEAYWKCQECETYFGDAQAQNEIRLNDVVLTATGHVNMVHSAAKDPTCTEAGNLAYWTCSCGKYFLNEQGSEETTLAGTIIPMTGHSLVPTPAVSATCTAEGNLAYWTCSECEIHFRDADGLIKVDASALKIAAKGHKLTATEAKAPTCTEIGNSAYWSCACGTHFGDAEGTIVIQLSDTVIPAKSHTLVKTDAAEATCTEEGHIAYWTCSECEIYFRDADGKMEIQLSATVIVAKGHNLIHVLEKSATCTEAGNIEYWSCACGKYFADAEGATEIESSDTILEAKGHTALTMTEAKSATCTEAGNLAYWTCTCGKHFADAEAATEIKLSATVVAAKGHTALTMTEAKSATCTDAGNLAYWTCICGKHFADADAKTEIALSATVIAAKNHALVAVAEKQPTCTDAGNTAYWTCGTCGKHYADSSATSEIELSETVVAPKGHTLTHTPAKEETCTEAGNTEYWTCSACGVHFSDGEGKNSIKLSSTVIAAKGHTLVKTNAVKATCTESGNTAYWTCTTCGKHYSDMYGRTETTLDATIVAAKGHTLVKTDAVDATCTENGRHAYWTCSVCETIFADAEGKEITTLDQLVIEASGHNYEDDVCTNCGDTIAPETFTVIFKDYDGTVLKTQDGIALGGKAIAPSVSGRSGYVFVGWDKAYDNVKADLVVTAKYQTVTDPTVAVNYAYAEVGDETVDVVISLLNNPGISSLKFYVTYGDELVLTTVTFSQDFGAYVTAPEPYHSPLPITFISPLASVDASGTFVTLTFHLSDSVKTATEIDLSISVNAGNTYNEALDPVDVASMGGKIIIQAND